jgi:thiamine phosphate synthase YjbQ (UPF0047 family)
MKLFTETITLSTASERELVDFTLQAQRIVRTSGIQEGLCALYAHGATAAWQNVFFCELDGPRRKRTVAVTILGS